MTAKPLLHPTTAEQLARVIHNPPHGLLLTGDPGIGKSTVVRWLAASVLDTTPAALLNHPYVTLIAPTNRSIGIEVVRQLEHVLSLKVATSRTGVSRLIIIEDAHTLTGESQNALLKTLEEPPAGTVLLLTASQPESLLATVRSRLQLITIHRPSNDELQAVLHEQGLTTSAIAKIMAVSGGLPGLAFAMAAGDETHPLVVAATTARHLLQQSSFERLTQVDKLAKNRDQQQDVLYILLQMAHAAILTGRGTARWQKVLQAAYDTEVALNNGAQPKLALTNLMLNL